MMSTDHAAMLNAVERSNQALDELVALLQEEQESLKSRKTEGFEALLTRKLETLQTLQQADGERERLLRGAGLSTDAAGMQHYLGQSALPALAAAWSRLTERLAEVQRLNEFNGTLIGKSLSQVERGLAVLLGDEPREAATYDTHGRQSGGSISREISRA